MSNEKSFHTISFETLKKYRFIAIIEKFLDFFPQQDLLGTSEDPATRQRHRRHPPSHSSEVVLDRPWAPTGRPVVAVRKPLCSRTWSDGSAPSASTSAPVSAIYWSGNPSPIKRKRKTDCIMKRRLKSLMCRTTVCLCSRR